MAKNNILRRYPIRTTRNKWEIKLFSQHKCDESCNIRFENDINFPEQIIVTNNPKYVDNKCEYYNIIEKTFIRFAYFNYDTSQLNDNEILYDADRIVIPDKVFTLTINYPLSYLFEIIVRTDNDGFTLKQLVAYIRTLYEYIYTEEERTSTPQLYNLKKYCSSCGNKDLQKYIENIQKNDGTCDICFTDYNEDDQAGKLKCGHIFHNACITRWFTTSGTCPICRSNVFECKNCDGSGIIYYQFTGTVIPIEQRGIFTYRNHTNGIFGIYDCDIEDLILDKMVYDRIKKKLYINIIS